VVPAGLASSIITTTIININIILIIIIITDLLWRCSSGAQQRLD